MTRQVQWRRGSTADHSTFAGADGEITVDSDKKTLVLHDGATIGGFPMARSDGVGSPIVLSDTFKHIVAIWQSQYDDLTEIDPNTLYIIIPPILVADTPGKLVLVSLIEADFTLI